MSNWSTQSTQSTRCHPNQFNSQHAVSPTQCLPTTDHMWHCNCIQWISVWIKRNKNWVYKYTNAEAYVDMTWHHMQQTPMQHQQLQSQPIKQRPMKSCRMLHRNIQHRPKQCHPLQRARCNNAQCNNDRYNDTRCNDNRCNTGPWNTALCNTTRYNTARCKASQCNASPCNTILQQAPDESADNITGGDQNLCSSVHLLKIRMTARPIPSSMTETTTANIMLPKQSKTISLLNKVVLSF